MVTKPERITYSIPRPSTDDTSDPGANHWPVRRALGIVASARGSGAVSHPDIEAASDARAPSTIITPLRLPRVSPEAARLARAISDARLSAFVRTLLDADVADTLSACVVDGSPDTAAFIEPAVLEISLGSRVTESQRRAAHLRIALDLHEYPALAIIASPTSEVRSSANEALRHAAAGLLLEPLLNHLAHAGMRDPFVIGLQRGGLEASSAVALSFAVAGSRHEVFVAADRHAVDLFEVALRDYNAGDDGGPALQPHLRVPGSLVVGVKPLAVETLQSLEAGDVLLRALFPGWNATLLALQADTSNPPPAPRSRPRAIAAWGTAGLIRLYATVELDGTLPVLAKELNMSEELDPALGASDFSLSQSDNPIQIGDLELPVQFEIDTVALPLAQLSALAPGYVVELPVALADARLRLVAHGQTIGYGELVTVGEYLGIRIIRMAHKHGPNQ